MRCEAIKKSDGKRCTSYTSRKTPLGYFCKRHRKKSSRNGVFSIPRRIMEPKKSPSLSDFPKHNLKINKILANYYVQRELGRRLKNRYKKFYPIGTPLDFSQADCLLDIFSILNAHYFNNELKSTICWGRLRLNIAGVNLSFSDSPCHITINYDLSKEIPVEIVAFLVYHEMLHEYIPPYIDNKGCRISHGPEFKKEEKKFPYYRDSKKFLMKSGFAIEKRRSSDEFRNGDMFKVNGAWYTISGVVKMNNSDYIVAENNKKTEFLFSPDEIDDISRRKNPQEEEGLTINDINDISCPLDHHEISGLQNDVIFLD